MEETGILTMETNASRGAKGISLGEWKHKTMLFPRKGLSDITNSSISDIRDGLIPVKQENWKTGSPVMISENTAKLLKENNFLMKALTERNAELQNHRLMNAKLTQQNWQLAQAHSQTLAELNLSRDRAKASQHELSCTSAVLKVRTQELKVKTQELEELKKLNKQIKRMQNITTPEGGHIKPVETVVDASLLSSPKKTRLPNRKRPQRSQSLRPMSLTNQAITEEENLRRKPLGRKSINLKAASCVPTEDVFEIEDTKFPKCSVDTPVWKDGGSCLQPEPSSPTIPIISVKEEILEDDQVSSSLRNRTSLGRPLRRAAVRVNSYKEMSLSTKLRRPDN